MKNYIGTLIMTITAAVLAGCSTPKMKTISIDSDPQGARVFLTAGKNESSATGGRNYLGTTPFKWTTELEGDGTFKVSHDGIPFYSDFVQSVVVFTAEPPTGATNLFPKREVYHSTVEYQTGNKAPEGIFFDLTKP